MQHWITQSSCLLGAYVLARGNHDTQVNKETGELEIELIVGSRLFGCASDEVTYELRLGKCRIRYGKTKNECSKWRKQQVQGPRSRQGQACSGKRKGPSQSGMEGALMG